jgi:hypothetical protein
MDRRTFNKSVSAIFGMLTLPGGLKAIPASVAKNPKIYYAANSVGISTTFDFSQAFTTGSLEIYENIEEKPDVDVDVSFWLDKDRKSERKVYFKGDNKTWSESASDRELVIGVDQSNTSVTSYKENGFGSFKTFEPGTENRIPLNELRLDAFYDIVVTYDSDYIITLENFQVTNIEDFNAV